MRRLAEVPNFIMSKKSYTIRKALLSDAEALTECMHAAYMIYTTRVEGSTLPPLTVDYEDEIRSFSVWVAESDGILVGGLILMPEDGHMTVANVAVHPKFQGNGLGRGLIALAEAEAKRQGYAELRLATHVLFVDNISFYTYLGWSEFDRDEVRVYMKKHIS